MQFQIQAVIGKVDVKINVMASVCCEKCKEKAGEEILPVILFSKHETTEERKTLRL